MKTFFCLVVVFILFSGKPVFARFQLSKLSAGPSFSFDHYQGNLPQNLLSAHVSAVYDLGNKSAIFTSLSIGQSIKADSAFPAKDHKGDGILYKLRIPAAELGYQYYLIGNHTKRFGVYTSASISYFSAKVHSLKRFTILLTDYYDLNGSQGYNPYEPNDKLYYSKDEIQSQRSIAVNIAAGASYKVNRILFFTEFKAGFPISRGKLFGKFSNIPSYILLDDQFPGAILQGAIGGRFYFGK